MDEHGPFDDVPIKHGDYPYAMFNSRSLYVLYVYIYIYIIK